MYYYNMKKISITLVALLVSCVTSFAQSKKMFRIDYSLFSQETADNNQNDEQETIFQGWVNKDFIRFYVEGEDPTVQLTNKNTGTSTMLYPGLKQFATIYGENEAPADHNFDDLNIEYVAGKQKKIAGYTCKLAKINASEDTDGAYSLEIWYTEQIPSIYWGDYEFLKKLPGAALSMSAMGSGIIAHKIEQEDVAETLLTVPQDFTEMEEAAAEAVDTESLGEGVYLYTDENTSLYGLRDEEGNVITQPKFTSILHFYEGNAVASDADYNYGTIDPKGNTVIPFNYSFLSYDTNSEQFLFSKNDKFGLMDKYGKVVINAKYDMLSFFEHGTAIFQIDGKSGLINEQDKQIVPANYGYIADRNATHFIAIEGELYNLYTIKDQKRLGGNIQFIATTEDPNIFLAQKDDKYGFLDQNGKVMIPFKYAYATGFSNGVAYVAMDSDMEDLFLINTKDERVEEEK